MYYPHNEQKTRQRTEGAKKKNGLNCTHTEEKHSEIIATLRSPVTSRYISHKGDEKKRHRLKEQGV